MSTAKPATMLRKQRVRTLWISDVHLGTRDCQAERLAAFLKRYQAERIYLVGDIIDGWKAAQRDLLAAKPQQCDPPSADHEQAWLRGHLRHRQP